jgi:hypothetical protein
MHVVNLSYYRYSLLSDDVETCMRMVGSHSSTGAPVRLAPLLGFFLLFSFLSLMFEVWSCSGGNPGHMEITVLQI